MRGRSLLVVAVAVVVVTGAVIGLVVLRKGPKKDSLDGSSNEVSPGPAPLPPKFKGPNPRVNIRLPVPKDSPGSGSQAKKKPLSFYLVTPPGTDLPRIEVILTDSTGKVAFEQGLRGHKGRFTLGTVPGPYRLKIQAFRYETVTVDVKPAHFEEERLTVTLTPDNRPVKVTVKVVSKSGQVSKGVVLLVDLDRPTLEYTLSRDALGLWYTDSLPPGRYKVCFAEKASAPRHRLLRFDAFPGATKEITAKVEFHSLRGYVVDGASGQPLPDAAVLIMGKLSEIEPFLGEPYRTDNAGRFETKMLPGGSYRVLARAPGYGMTQTRHTPRKGTEADVHIEMKKSRGITLAFKDAAPTGILWASFNGFKLMTCLIPLRPNPDGAYVLDLVPARYSIVLEGIGISRTGFALHKKDFEAATPFEISAGQRGR